MSVAAGSEVTQEPRTVITDRVFGSAFAGAPPKAANRTHYLQCSALVAFKTWLPRSPAEKRGTRSHCRVLRRVLTPPRASLVTSLVDTSLVNTSLVDTSLVEPARPTDFSSGAGVCLIHRPARRGPVCDRGATKRAVPLLLQSHTPWRRRRAPSVPHRRNSAAPRRTGASWAQRRQ